MTEIIRYQGHPTTISLFYSSIFNLIVLILLNGLLRRYAPRWVFSQSELITIYVMLNIGAALVGHDSMQILVSLMPYATYMRHAGEQVGPALRRQAAGLARGQGPGRDQALLPRRAELSDPENLQRVDRAGAVVVGVHHRAGRDVPVHERAAAEAVDRAREAQLSAGAASAGYDRRGRAAVQGEAALVRLRASRRRSISSTASTCSIRRFR